MTLTMEALLAQHRLRDEVETVAEAWDAIATALGARSSVAAGSTMSPFARVAAAESRAR